MPWVTHGSRVLQPESRANALRHPRLMFNLDNWGQLGKLHRHMGQNAMLATACIGHFIRYVWSSGVCLVTQWCSKQPWSKWRRKVVFISGGLKFQNWLWVYKERSHKDKIFSEQVLLHEPFFITHLLYNPMIMNHNTIYIPFIIYMNTGIDIYRHIAHP